MSSLFSEAIFPYKVQKISLNAGFTCPNRDGKQEEESARYTYCNNQTFNPDYCRTEKSITRQLEEGKQFFAHKYPEMKYLAYFQAYTNHCGQAGKPEAEIRGGLVGRRGGGPGHRHPS